MTLVARRNRILNCVFCSRSIDPTTTTSSDLNGHHQHETSSADESETTWQKIFEHLLIPVSKYRKAFKVCKKEGICPNCQETFDEIGGLKTKLEEMGPLMQRKVEETERKSIGETLSG
jgi:hypothetical protein